MEGDLVEDAPLLEPPMLPEWGWDLVVIIIAAIIGALYILISTIRKNRLRREVPGAFPGWIEEPGRGSIPGEIGKQLGMLQERMNSLSMFTLRLQSRIEKLEDELTSVLYPENSGERVRSSPVGLPEQNLQGIPLEGEPAVAQAIFAPEPHKSPSDVAAELLSELNARGGASEVARLSGLRSWMLERAPHLRPEPILTAGDLWLLVVITGDPKEGIVIPTLDTVVGPGEVFKWFDCSRYDGTQPLKRADIVSLAEALRDPSGAGWIVARKGRIDRTKREGGA